MIHYHGSPMGGPTLDAGRFYRGRHILVSLANPKHLAVAAETASSFVLDNGAFSAWTKGKPMDVDRYAEWVREWHQHPGFDWALIPDVIDGTEEENDAMLQAWVLPCAISVPVWHLHESFDRLDRLCRTYPRVALGSSGRWANPGSPDWWMRIDEAMQAACDDRGRPKAKLHGLRMLDPEIVCRLPLSSADSTNACQNAGSVARFGTYKPPHCWQRATTIADRIEAAQSAAVWVPYSFPLFELSNAEMP